MPLAGQGHHVAQLDFSRFSSSQDSIRRWRSSHQSGVGLGGFSVPSLRTLSASSFSAPSPDMCLPGREDARCGQCTWRFFLLCNIPSRCKYFLSSSFSSVRQSSDTGSAIDPRDTRSKSRYLDRKQAPPSPSTPHQSRPLTFHSNRSSPFLSLFCLLLSVCAPDLDFPPEIRHPRPV